METKEIKRKRRVPEQLTPPKSTKKQTMATDVISPTSKVFIFKIDIISCNGQPVSQYTELSSSDIEEIWTQALKRDTKELSGYTSSKAKSKEIRVQYQLKLPMSIRDIASESEYVYERITTSKTDIFKFKVIGLREVRQAQLGETVKVTVDKPNFDITPEQVVEWISKFGTVLDGHRYPI
jgi:hypothetical protein